MKIQAGKYILNSDSLSMWVEEEYKGKDSKGRTRMQTRRISGYHNNFKALLESFCARRIGSSAAENMKDLLKDLDQTYQDMLMLNDEAVKGDFRRLRDKHSGKKGGKAGNDEE